MSCLLKIAYAIPASLLLLALSCINKMIGKALLGFQIYVSEYKCVVQQSTCHQSDAH